MKSIVFVGFMASGKTTVGKALATYLNTPFYDTDVLVEKKYNKAISKIFEQYGENEFRTLETDVLKDLQLKDAVISTGGGIILKRENREYLKQFTVIWLDVPFEVILNRLNGDDTRPLWKGERDDRELMYKNRKKYYKEVADIHLILNNEKPDEIVSKIIAYLNI